MSFKKINNIKEFHQMVEGERKFFLLKNSITCPISHEAYKETERFVKENDSIPVFYLNVQEARELSNEIAEKFAVKHESPQILLFHDGDVIWHDSHWEITRKNLKEVLQK